MIDFGIFRLRSSRNTRVQIFFWEFSFYQETVSSLTAAINWPSG